MYVHSYIHKIISSYGVLDYFSLVILHLWHNLQKTLQLSPQEQVKKKLEPSHMHGSGLANWQS